MVLGLSAARYLPLEDALGTADGQLGDLITQLVAGTLGSQCGFLGGGLLGGGNDASSLGTCLVDEFGSLLVSAGADFDRSGASLLHFLFDPFLGGLQLRLGLVGSCQTGCDLLAAFIQCRSDGRPDELGGEPPERQEDEALNDDRGVDVHARFSVSTIDT